MFLHYFDFILEYGAPALTYGGWWEKAHRFLVKLPYLRTGRRVSSLLRLLVLRVRVADTIRRKKAVTRVRASPDRYVWTKVKVDGRWRKKLVRVVDAVETVGFDEAAAGEAGGVREHSGYLDVSGG